MLLRRTAALLVAALLVASCDSPTGSDADVPARLDVVSGARQRATVGTELPEPLVVRIVDRRGRPVANHVVNFRVTAGGGAVFAGTAITNADGEARERWTLGTAARDSQYVEARAVDPATGERLVFAVFSALGVADVPANISPTGPAALSGSPGGVMPVGVRVLDRYGNRVAGTPVVWQAGEGTVTPAEGVTDSSGVAAAQWTLAYAVGAQTMTAFAGMSVSTQFTAATPAPSGSQLVIVSGERQRAEVGAALPQPLVVRLQNAAGQPLRGAAVAWAASAGTITAAAAVTDAQGQVSATWDPGTAPGTRTATASVAGANSVLFTAEATPGVPAELRKASGDAQTANTGTLLPVPLGVSVLDAYGNLLSGHEVRWRVVSGGGTLTGAVSIPTAGPASNQWTLGAALGEQVVEAEVGTLRARFTATATAPVVRIVSPAADAFVGDTFVLRVTVSSPQAAASVTAAVGGRAFALAPAGAGWVGTVNLKGLPHGAQRVVVTASSASGPLGSTVGTWVYDTPPVLQVDSPAALGVATPTIRVRASCADDDPRGCVSLLVRLPGRTSALAEGTGSVDAVVSLAAHSGGQVTLNFEGRDRAGLTTIVTREVYVETSPAWTEVASAPGIIFDADAGRVLFHAAGRLQVLARATGAVQAVSEQEGRTIRSAFLTPRGAIFSEGSATGTEHNVRDWRDGAVASFGNPHSTLEVKGGYALWNENSTLIRRDLETGTNVVVSTSSGNNSNDVAANGDVVFWTVGYDVHRFRGGATTPLTSAADPLWNTYPVTDGINVVYRKHYPIDTSPAGYRIMLVGPSGVEEALTPFSARETDSQVGFRAEGGWVAYTQPDAADVMQVWRRAPDGTVTKISATGSDAWISSLGANGDLAYLTAAGRRFVVKPGGTPVDVGRSWGRPVWIGGVLHIILGRSLFRISY